MRGASWVLGVLAGVFVAEFFVGGGGWGVSFFVGSGAGALSLWAYAETFSAALLLYVVLTIGVWKVVWFSGVMLGEIRANIAFLFVGLYLVSFTVAIGLAEIFYPNFMGAPLGVGTILVCLMGVFLCPLVGVVVLVVSKFVPHACSGRGLVRGAVPWVLVLLAGCDVLWLYHSFLEGGYGVACLVGYLVLAGLTLLLFRLWGPSTRVLRWCAIVLVVVSLLPVGGAQTGRREAAYVPTQGLMSTVLEASGVE